MLFDTIAAISTPIGTGGIGIVRISGKEAISITDKIFKNKKNKALSLIKTHTINYGYIYDPENDEIYDEVLVMLMKAPNTFTKEDVVEINCHGGLIVIKKVLELILKYGARIAEPGEFTKRAFLNGRIDLSQAEAVIDIINAKTELSLKSSVHQLEGNISKEIRPLREELLKLIAHIEASIDYPEYDIEDLSTNIIKDSTESLMLRVDKILETADSGRIIKEGIETVIVGKPNVGKSSLMNTLLKEQRAIVTDIPGTTRDVIQEYVNIEGIPLKIIDTAGIRQTSDVVEKLGVERSKELIEHADLVIMMLDASRKISEEDIQILDLVKDKKTIVILNKTDLNREINLDDIEEKLEQYKIIDMSIKDKTGINELEKVLKDMFFNGNINIDNDIYITSVRHKDSLLKAKESLMHVIESIEVGMPEDCYSIDLKNCYEFLGQITGDSLSESIIDKIFSEFCLGK